jgi:hypothetical protein
MRHCYCCDAPIPGDGFRRTVGTSSNKRTYYGKRVSWSRSKSEGLRTVCLSCAERIDRKNKIDAYIGGLVSLIVIAFIIFGSLNRNINISSNNIATASDRTPRDLVGQDQGTLADVNTTSNIKSLNDTKNTQELGSSGDNFIIKDGYDALGIGIDMPNMPLISQTPSECQADCANSRQCTTYVFNKLTKRCYLKYSTGILFGSDVAYLGYKSTSGIDPRISSIQTKQRTAFVGQLYNMRRNMLWANCALECDNDQNCVAFNFDGRAKECAMLKSVSREIASPMFSSGVKNGSIHGLD